MDKEKSQVHSAIDSRFEERKRDHIEVSMSPEVQAKDLRDIDQIELIHEALPELDFSEINIQSELFGNPTPTPFFISSMTAGHSEGAPLNLTLAKVSARRGWPMGVGSQRRQLFDKTAHREWQNLRQAAPGVVLFGNIGIAQLIESGSSAAAELSQSLQAQGMIVHLNPLQECIQPEGTPQFKGGFQALRELCEKSQTPIIVKETGCGISEATAQRLLEAGVSAIDVAGAGGTHWGRVEGQRSLKKGGASAFEVSETFKNWGISTVDSLDRAARARAQFSSKRDVRLWASGGVQNGLDAARLLAFGADRVGFAKEALKAALAGEESLNQWMEKVERELAIALFCTGCRTLTELKSNKVWRWRAQR